jgi:hypothetical protein
MEDMQMPVYAFELRDGSKPVTDDTGLHFPDRPHAFDYAQEIIRELMSGCEAQTRSWRLDVYEKGEGLVFKIPFVHLDPAFARLEPSLRTTIERLCDSYRSLREAVHAAHATVRESRALVARSRGEPYLAAYAGERTIRG